MKMNDAIRNMFEGCESMDKGKILDRLMSKYNLKESTAKTYYYMWKREFMGGANCIPVKPDIPEAVLKEEKNLSKSFIDAILETQVAPWPETEEEAKKYTGVIIIRDPVEPENDIELECESEEEMKEYKEKCEAQCYEVQEAVTVQDIVDMAQPKIKIKLIPVVVSGGYFTYRMDYEGVKIESGMIDVITTDCIEEQTAALELWKKYYSER